MPLEPSIEQQEQLAGTFRRANAPITVTERRTEWPIALGFFAAVAGIWLLRPPQGFAVLTAAMCVLVMALASRVRFDTPFGFRAATQLAFVPLLFALPVAVVPIAVLVAFVLAPLPVVGVPALFATERNRRLQSLLELSSAYGGTALVLGDVVEADDNYTGADCKGVLGLTLAVGEELGLGAERRRNLEFGAL